MAFLALPQQYCPRTMSNQLRHPQRQQYPQCRNPRPIPPRCSRFPGQINLANRHQIRQLHLLSRPQLFQRVQVFTCIHQKSPMPHQADATRSPLHQGHNADRTNVTTSACNQNQGTPCPDIAHKQAIHQQHGPFPRPIPQRQLIHHARLTRRPQRHLGRTLPVLSRLPPHRHSKSYHVPPPEERPQHKSADARQRI